MRKNLFFDSETCGLHGMPVLFQYAFDDGPITLYEVWKNPVGRTLDLIEEICENNYIGFNNTFDWFQICKTYTILRQFPRNILPETCIDAIGEAEREGQYGPCVKPYRSLDLMLHSRRGPYQSLMAREDIRIRRVPTVLAYALAEELEQRIEIDGIYFARRSDPHAPRWNVYDIPNQERTGINPDFKDVVLKFHPAGGLKFLAEHALGITDTIHFSEIEVNRKYWPKELGYAPFATALSSRDDDWRVYEDGRCVGRTWPALIKYHIDHWHTHAKAREYAEKDIVYTRGLWEHFGKPEAGDDDSELACMVAAVRWRGYNIDAEGIKELREAAVARSEGPPTDPNAVRRYLLEVMDPTEAITIRETTAKAKLEEVATWRCDCTYNYENKLKDPEPDCEFCGGSGTHPAGVRAATVLDARKAIKEIELYDKLLTSKRFFASFNVIGTLSSRMSGADGLNAQGIKREPWVRRMFPLWDDGYILCGGDFSSFEVTLADAAYGDPALRQDLINKVKIHAVMASALYPKYSYDDIVRGYNAKPEDYKRMILAGEVEAPECDITNDAAFEKAFNIWHDQFVKMYTDGKQAVFALIYGGDAGTIERKLNIPIAIAEKAYNDFMARYPGIAAARKKIFDMFCSMRQEGGPGTAVVWNDPAEYVESLLGFRRYFTLENKICLELFQLANNPPPEWRAVNVRVRRRDREQFACGALASALYGAAFQIQAAAMRAAANHVIQSTGGEITKKTQRNIWDIQPHGVHEFKVRPMNVHDELLVVAKPEVASDVNDIVRSTVESYRSLVPLIGIGWESDLDSWAGTH